MTPTKLTRQELLEDGWRTRSACKDMHPNVFYPPAPDEPKQKPAPGRKLPVYNEAKAKRICRGCPVRTECVDDALRRGDMSGMHGGLTEEEKVSERRKRQRRGTLYAA
ncbi:WhiB family transcriptional regulator [Nonomuraea sp. NPDC051941]|uniref:WhiB family transcriptional regulator n=1 Tax=Nonomuraea sp. NPDC051941 TaxID=3364373 RepID=UPI0037C6CEC7